MTDLRKLIDAVEAGDDAAFRRCNRSIFYTPCQDIALQMREDNCRHAYSGSLDAARELHDNLLPGFEYRLSASNAKVYPYNNTEDVAGEYGMADNPARAWLLAILRAYRAKIGGAE